MKRSWGLFAAGAVFSLSLASAAEREPRYVEVTGEGEASGAPDRVRVDLGLESFAKSVKDAQQANARQTRDLLDALKSLKIEPKDVRTNAVQVEPRYEYEGGKRRLIDYAARKNFTVLIRDISRYGLIVDAALEAGVKQVGGARFETSEAESLEEEARKRAAADARRKAEVLAAALGETAGRPLSIVEAGPAGPVPLGGPALRAAAAESVPDQLAPGELTFHATVQVRFELE